MRAGLYARVSREEQAEGYSLEAQLVAMRTYCVAEAHAVVREYIEPGQSGTHDERPALQEALQDCQNGTLDLLLTHQLDRLYRNLELQLRTLSNLGKWGVSYVSVVERIDYSTPQGRFFLSMLGALNEYYVANLRREIRKGKGQRARSGLSNASRAPYGYELSQGQYVLCSGAAATVQWLFEQYATGAHSDLDLATLLNDLSKTPPAGRSVRWTREAVRYILRNPFYEGTVRYAGINYSGKHQGIVSSRLFQEVQAVRAKRTQAAAGARPHRTYLLSRLAVCASCGSRLTSQAIGGKGNRPPLPYYGCPSRRTCLTCSSVHHWVACKIIDRQMDTLVARLQLPTDWRDRLAEMEHEDEAPAPDQRLRLQAKLERLRETYILGDLSRPEYERRRLQLREELDRLPSVQPAPSVRAGHALVSIGEAWALATPDDRHEMLRTLFEAIVVDIDQGIVTGLRPHADFVPLLALAGMEVTDGYYQVVTESGALA